MTFLFTDIEGSTRRWEVHSDHMAPCIVRHDTILRTAVEESHGCLVKMLGDGVMAVFVNASDALSAALAGQAAIEAADWSPIPDLRVRMGIHTGWCEPHGDDYFGAVVNRASRIADAGHGGQILVSAASGAIVEQLGNAQLVSRGEVRLKDLGEPIELFQVMAPGLDNEQLPLRTLDPELGDLPIQRTTLVGRSEELEHAVQTLESSRLVTLLGLGGVGKTCLAIHIAGEVSQQFDTGVRFIDLSEVSPGGGVAAAMLDQLLRRNPATMNRDAVQDPLEGVIRSLAGSEALLVVDNCEHVADDASSVVDAILNNCPQVRVLATSREPLKIPGEQVLPVVPLSGEHDGTNPAVRLFIERSMAGGAAPPSEESLPVVARICELVDGLPLGIELAAARSLHLSVEQLAARLEDHHQILQARDRTRPDRHKSIEGLLRWSVDLLEPPEQLLLARLGMFSGPVEIDAIEALCGDDELPASNVVDHLGTLVDRSLVVYQEQNGHYTLLNIVRSFARDQLDAQATALGRERHANWCLRSLRDTTTEETDDRLALFMSAHGPEVTAASNWAVSENRTDLSWSLAGLSWRWYETTGRVREGLDLVQRALETGAAEHSDAWASAATGAGSLAMVLGDLDYAQDLHRRAAEAFNQCGSDTDEARARIGLAMAMMLSGHESAANEAHKALGVFEDATDYRGMGHAHAALGIIAARAADHDHAETRYLQALSMFRLAHQRRDAASVLSNLGNLSQDRSEYRRASRFYDGALQLYREIQDHRGAGLILNNLCIVAQARDNHDRAVELSLEAIEEFDHVHDGQGAAAARHNLANLAAEAGDHQTSLRYYAQAINGFRDARDPRGVIMALDAATRLARRCGHEALAWKYQIDQASVLHKLGLQEPTRRTLQSLASHAMIIGDTDISRRVQSAADSMLSSDIARALDEARLVEFGDRPTTDPQDDGPELPAPGQLDELTKREQELLAEVGSGKTNTEIAETLFISRRTVDAHLSHIRTKLGVSDRSKLIVLARENLRPTNTSP